MTGSVRCTLSEVQNNSLLHVQWRVFDVDTPKRRRRTFRVRKTVSQPKNVRKMRNYKHGPIKKVAVFRASPVLCFIFSISHSSLDLIMISLNDSCVYEWETGNLLFSKILKRFFPSMKAASLQLKISGMCEVLWSNTGEPGRQVARVFLLCSRTMSFTGKVHSRHEARQRRK